MLPIIQLTATHQNFKQHGLVANKPQKQEMITNSCVLPSIVSKTKQIRHGYSTANSKDKKKTLNSFVKLPLLNRTST